MTGLRQRVERCVRQVVREVLAEQRQPFSAPDPFDRRRPLVAANWKMNGSQAFARAYAQRFATLEDATVEVVLCPPAILLATLGLALGSDSRVVLGAQDLHPEAKGAFTGEHSAGMLRDAGTRYVIVGHSERRGLFGESDALVAAKLTAALGAVLRPILCVGESLAERESGATFRVLRAQLTAALAGLGHPAPDPADLVVAYEPVWAIGTGRNASTGQAQEALAFIRQRLAELFTHGFAERVRLLYGGSASPDNAAELAAQSDLDGFLVGGAGLDADKLIDMVAQTARSKTARAEARSKRT